MHEPRTIWHLRCGNTVLDSTDNPKQAKKWLHPGHIMLHEYGVKCPHEAHHVVKSEPGPWVVVGTETP